jgi:hypothetical protein
MKPLYFFIFLSVFKLSAQDNRTAILGKVFNHSNPVENVHIINKTSNKGTISNKNGAFKITVKENDTLHFSDIQFKTKTVIITKKDLKTGNIKVNLYNKTNELEEVVIVKRKNLAKGLGLPNAGKKPLDKLERNLNAYSQKSTPIVILQALLLKPGGIDDIYNIVSGNRKRDRKLKSLIDQDIQTETDRVNVQLIRTHFKEDFFIYTVKIPGKYIDDYISYCLPKEIVFLFERERYLEIIDIFIRNKDAYLSTVL